MSNLKVSRDSGYADRARKYKIICNSECLGKIGNGETMDFDLSPGDYELYLKIDWCRSNKIRFSASPNEQVIINASSSLRGIKLLFAIVYAVLLPHKYLWAHRANS